MKIVTNGAYGGFCLSQEFLEKYPHLEFSERNDPELIEAIEEFGQERAGYDYLNIDEIPDSATDWTILEYDGLEDVLYVQDGKIHYA